MVNYVDQIYVVTYDPMKDGETGIEAFVKLEDAQKFAAEITKGRSGIADLDTIDTRFHGFFESYVDGKMVENGHY